MSQEEMSEEEAANIVPEFRGKIEEQVNFNARAFDAFSETISRP